MSIGFKKFFRGDVVYCDIPYVESHYSYQIGKFDHGRFYDWAADKDYPVYISSTQCDDDRFVPVWEKLKPNLIAANNKAKPMLEQVFVQRKCVCKYFNERWGIV